MKFKISTNLIFKTLVNSFKVFLFFIFFASSNAFALGETATSKLYFKTSAGIVAPGSTFSVGILLDSVSPINAFVLEVGYDKTKLEFLDSDNSNSIVDFWQTKPVILPNAHIGFSGGIIKSFTGKGGSLIKLSFKSLAEGDSKISFVKNNLYVADGKGTEIKAISEIMNIKVKESAKVVSEEVVPFTETKIDVEIKKELENYKSEVFWDKMLVPTLLFTSIIFVILVVAVYNKLKRKL